MAIIISPDDPRSEVVARDLAVNRIASAGLQIAAILGLNGLETEVAVRLGHALRDLDTAVAALATDAFTEVVVSPNNVVACEHCGKQVYVREHQHPLTLAERAGDAHGLRSFLIIGGSALLHQCFSGEAFPTNAVAAAAGHTYFDD